MVFLNKNGIIIRFGSWSILTERLRLFPSFRLLLLTDRRSMLGIILFSLFISYTAYLGLCFLRHWSLARKIGLPYVSFPISSHNILFLSLFETRFVPYVINTWLSPKLADFIYGSAFKTRWAARDRLHRRYGGVYMLITPSVSTCMVCDASVASQICMSRHGFPKPIKQYGKSC